MVWRAGDFREALEAMCDMSGSGALAFGGIVDPKQDLPEAAQLPYSRLGKALASPPAQSRRPLRRPHHGPGRGAPLELAVYIGACILTPHRVRASCGSPMSSLHCRRRERTSTHLQGNEGRRYTRRPRTRTPPLPQFCCRPTRTARRRWTTRWRTDRWRGCPRSDGCARRCGGLGR